MIDCGTPGCCNPTMNLLAEMVNVINRAKARNFQKDEIILRYKEQYVPALSTKYQMTFCRSMYSAKLVPGSTKWEMYFSEGGC